MNTQYNYFAFISYKSEDVEWAIWLQHELEHYHLPASYNGRTDVRQELRPVFRDIDELSAGNLPEQIKHALVNSENLIVICSPQAAKSHWVNQEVETFISLGKVNQIFPFIVEGNSPKEFFPPSLLNLPKNEERLGGDVSKNGRDAAFVKVVAGMLGVGFDSLWNRYEKEKAEEERKIREQRDNLLRLQSRYLAEKVNTLVDEGDSYTARLLALEALPNDLENPDRPYVAEAEYALRNACNSSDAIFRGHTEEVTSISFSTDGQFLASASFDNSICIWEVRTGKCLMTLEKPSMLTGKFKFEVLDGLLDEIDYLGFNYVSFSQDGKKIVAAGKDATIYVWDLSTQECITKINNFDIYAGYVNCVKFTPDGKKIIAGGGYLHTDNEYVSSFSIWDSETGSLILEHDTGGEVCDIAISSDGKKIATAGYDSFHLWDSITFNQIKVTSIPLPQDSSSFSPKIRFSPDGKMLAVTSNCTIRLWDLKSGKPINKIKTRGLEISSFSFSSDSQLIYLSSKDGIIYEQNIQGGKLIEKMTGHTSMVNAIEICPIGQYIASCSKDHTIRLWNKAEGKPYRLLRCENSLSNGGQQYFNIEDDYKIEFNDGRLVNMFDYDTCKLLNPIPVEDIRTYEDRDSCLYYNNSRTLKISYRIEGNSLLVDDQKNDIYYSLESPFFQETTFIAFSPDEKDILILAYNNDIALLKNLPQNKEEYSSYRENFVMLKGHTDIVRCAVFSPDGNFVVSISDDNTIRIWNSQTGLCLQTYQLDDSTPNVYLTPDGRYIIVCYYNKNVEVFKFCASHELINETRAHFKERELTPEERKKYYLD